MTIYEIISLVIAAVSLTLHFIGLIIKLIRIFPSNNEKK